METRANNFIIGLFVLSVLGLILGFIYWMRNDATGSSSKTYAVIFDGSVQGLTEASPVLFNGIRFGAVRSIGVVPENTAQVRAIISVRGDTPVRIDSRARIAQQGLAGFIAMEITPGSQQAPMLAATATEPFAVIRGETAGGGMLSGVNDAASKASVFVSNLNDLVTRNEGTLTRTIANLEAFSAMMAERRDDVGAVVQDARQLSARFVEISKKLDTAMERIAGTGPDDKEAVVAQVQQAVVSFRQLAERLDKSVGARADGVMQQTERGLREFELFMKDARRLADSLDRVVTKVERNPAGFLLGGSSSPKY
jgi:phospholipid/cholesterol/gamma-HCH transport system substrate-binding protein